MMIDLWELRNGEVHGKGEATKQQKGKAKAAISVQALHDLEEIARPSDAFLFYEDIKEEIKHATAVKLEGFIAMKTRPIYNSVKKWAKRSKNGVKLIVGQIKKRGKNHREIIERVEKRQRDYFQHKPHKKPRNKENKRKGQYSLFHNETNITLWFIFIKNDLY